MSEIYISCDIEADGPVPGLNSMLSLGAAAFLFSKEKGDFEMVGTHEVNFETMEGAAPDPDTAEWWKKQPEAWTACRKNTVPAVVGMHEFSGWVQSFGKKPVFVGYPAGFDFMFVYWYFIKCLGPGKSPFSFSALDIKSYAMAVMGEEYRNVTKRAMSPWLPPDCPHTHVALDDAIEQGWLFCNLWKENRKRQEQAARYCGNKSTRRVPKGLGRIE